MGMRTVTGCGGRGTSGDRDRTAASAVTGRGGGGGGAAEASVSLSENGRKLDRFGTEMRGEAGQFVTNKVRKDVSHQIQSHDIITIRVQHVLNTGARNFVVV